MEGLLPCQVLDQMPSHRAIFKPCKVDKCCYAQTVDEKKQNQRNKGNRLLVLELIWLGLGFELMSVGLQSLALNLISMLEFVDYRTSFFSPS